MGIHDYVSKHKNIMGIVVLLTRDPQLSKSIYVVELQILIEFDC